MGSPIRHPKLSIDNSQLLPLVSPTYPMLQYTHEEHHHIHRRQDTPPCLYPRDRDGHVGRRAGGRIPQESRLRGGGVRAPAPAPTPERSCGRHHRERRRFANGAQPVTRRTIRPRWPLARRRKKPDASSPETPEEIRLPRSVYDRQSESRRAIRLNMRFVDTNVLIYAVSVLSENADKRRISLDLLDEEELFHICSGTSGILPSGDAPKPSRYYLTESSPAIYRVLGRYTGSVYDRRNFHPSRRD